MSKGSRIKLTKTVIDQAVARTARYILWDSVVPGFGIRIEPAAIKTYFVRYRAHGGGRSAPQRLVTVGRHGLFTVEEARQKAKVILGEAAIGDDPAKRKAQRRRELSMSDLIDLYEEEGCFIQRGRRQGEPMKELTKRYTLARLRHHVVSLLGKRRIGGLLPGDIENFVRDVSNGKSAKDEKLGRRRRIIVRGGDGAARKVFRDLSAVFSFAGRRGLVDENPCDRAAVRKTDNQKSRYLAKEEIGRLGAACDELEAEGANRKGIDIARLWALTGCRRQEIAELKWSEVDFDRGLLILADSKTGKSIRPLGVAAETILRRIQKKADCDFVFPADTGDGAFQGAKGVWRKIVARAKLEGVTPHTLRHTLASMAISSGEPMAMTGAILGHANPRSTAIYAHVDHDPAKKSADRVSAMIADALAGLTGRVEMDHAKRVADRADDRWADAL